MIRESKADFVLFMLAPAIGAAPPLLWLALTDRALPWWAALLWIAIALAIGVVIGRWIGRRIVRRMGT